MKYVSLVLILALFASCGNHQESGQQEEENTKEFFPVASFVTGQIREVDSLQLPTVKYLTTGSHTDTLTASMEEFRHYANEFTKTDINNPAVKKYYKETSFADQSIPSVTFTYSTSNEEMAVKRIDVIVNPNPVGEDKVRSIYIEKVEKHNDTVAVKKLYWKTDRNYQIITSKTIGAKPEEITQLKIVWDASD